jgi:uncharacterized phage protein (TIGR01671 family)
MREIKFRAWDIEDKVMLDIYSLDFVRNGHFWIEDARRLMFEPKDVVLMQYTGLKDKNGKEIYEGDIITLDGFSPSKYEICFIEGAFCLWREELPMAIESVHIEDSTGNHAEVIGNIYENTELLTGDK